MSTLAKALVPFGYAKDSVALTQADANAAAADYTVADVINLIEAAQRARANVTPTGTGSVTRTDA